MRRRHHAREKERAHFVTPTIEDWLPVFILPDCCEIPARSLDFCRTMEQKVTHVHNNPVRRGWVASSGHWRYSSAHEWLPGAEPLFRRDAWR
jgi:hypothetical protein